MKRRRVGVRALRLNLSRYLARAAHGETFEVTDHGRPVAIVAPVAPGRSAMEQLIASGRATRPAGDLLELGAPPRLEGPSLSAALQELRAERFDGPRARPARRHRAS